MSEDNLTVTTYEVLSCPFCGGKPVFRQYITKSAVMCDNALCSVDMYTKADTLAKAIKQWNTRHKARICYIDVYKTIDTIQTKKE